VEEREFIMDLESIYETVKFAATYGGIALGSCATVYFGLAVANHAGREITSLTELERTVEEESENLSLKDIRCVEIEGDRAFAEAAQKGNGLRDSVYFGGTSRKRNVIRHELFHLKRLDNNPRLKKLFTSGEDTLSSLKRRLQYFFIEEPLAMMYGTLGMKIGLKNKQEQP
jgi:hypothetical protein